MTKESSYTPPEPKPVEILDTEMPIWVAIHQTDQRNFFETFNGWDAERRCRDYAAERSAKLKRQVIIVGPQKGYAVPPENTLGDIKEVSLAKPDDALDKSDK